MPRLCRPSRTLASPRITSRMLQRGGGEQSRAVTLAHAAIRVEPHAPSSRPAGSTSSRAGHERRGAALYTAVAVLLSPTESGFKAVEEVEEVEKAAVAAASKPSALPLCSYLKGLWTSRSMCRPLMKSPASPGWIPMVSLRRWRTEGPA